MIKATQELYLALGERYPTHAKIGRFLISGGLALGADLLLLYLFTDAFHIWYLASAVLAFIFAFFVSFGLQKFWTFRDHSREGMHMQMGIYFLITFINLCINTALVYAFVEWATLHYLLAQILASGLIACESYFVYQRFVFRT